MNDRRSAKWRGAFFLGSAVVALAARGASGEPVKCGGCHSNESADFARSVHASLECRECHGGDKVYDVAPGALAGMTGKKVGLSAVFDHGTEFRGKPARAGIPNLCGDCHADVERMNPYGLRTDQLSRYWTSVHGKMLRDKSDEHVAICIDCHGSHAILSAREPDSKTNPLNVPATCGHCHENSELMGQYGLPTEIVEEYRESVHGRMLLEQKDAGAPTCATCHGNHSAMPPGFATVGAVCGQCHNHVTKYFEKSIHASLEDYKGCVQCHGGGEGRHDHLIERITKPPGVLIQRYAQLLQTASQPTKEEIVEAINPFPRTIITRALPSCTMCHDEPDEDESIAKLFGLLDKIADAECYYVETANRLEQVGKGVLLVTDQNFKFEAAKTHLIGLAPLQHTLDNALVAEKVSELNGVCDEVNKELDDLEAGLRWRYRALIPIWVLSVFFSGALYVKYRRLRAEWVKPLPTDREG